MVRSSAANPAHRPPAPAPAMSAIQELTALVPIIGNCETAAAAAAPASSWPSPPMLNTPARNAIATESPVRMTGVARTRVPDVMAYPEPIDPRTSAAIDGAASKPSTASSNGIPTTTPARASPARTNESQRRGSRARITATETEVEFQASTSHATCGVEDREAETRALALPP